MKAVQRLLGKLSGLHFSQDYLCLDRDSLTDPLQVFVVNGSRPPSNLANKHVFCGYSPLVFCFSKNDINTTDDNIELVFAPQSAHLNDQFRRKDAVAGLKMEKIRATGLEEELLFFRGTEGIHRFLPAIQQRAISLNDRLFNRKPGNVFLPGNLLKQVQIAYSLPRTISLVSAGSASLVNVFPTDLHGKAGKSLYIMSLRQAGKACAQVLSAGRILLSEVKSAMYRKVYGLGKNHMQEPKEPGQFPLSGELSQSFHLPIPDDTVLYRELVLAEHFTEGIHRIMLFHILTEVTVVKQAPVLSHVHNVYASWRWNKGLGGNYLQR